MILGICDGHDSGAALVDREGRVRFAVSEERLTRVKHQPGFPRLAIEACLRVADQVHAVAIAERAGRLPFRLLDRWYRRSDPGRGPLAPLSLLAERGARLAARSFATPEVALSRRLLGQRLAEMEVRAPIELVDHHVCHAWTAAAGSTDALVVTMDAFGDGRSGGLWRSDGHRLRLLRVIDAPHGAAILFGAVGQLLGFAAGDEGKIVARAAHGDPARLRAVFARALVVRDGLPRLELSPVELRRSLHGGSAVDVAAALQERAEEVVAAVIGQEALRQGCRELALAGGLFNNVAINRVVADLPGIEATYVFPAMGDAGLCIGAAFSALARRGGVPQRVADARLGPAVEPDPEPVDVVPALLAGRIVARCTGPMEFGPRALGNRSLLFRAEAPERAAALNQALGRDPLMPFAPIMTAEAAPRLVRGWSTRVEAMTRLMTVALPATDRLTEVAPTAVHTDGTARVQVLRAEDDPVLHAVLRRLPDEVCINTSLNVHGEPIVASRTEAVRTAGAVGAVTWFG